MARLKSQTPRLLQTPRMPRFTTASPMGRLQTVVGSKVQIQRLTGARPGEDCEMRTADIDTSVEVWTLRCGDIGAAQQPVGEL